MTAPDPKSMSQQQCKDYLDSIGYGNTRNYRKITMDHSLCTTWAKNITIAKIAYKAAYGKLPAHPRYED